MKEVKTDKKINFSERLDNIISVFSPKLALRRKMYRHALKIASFSSYRGAEKNRLRDSWMPPGNSADQDLLSELPILRDRSRWLNRNDGYASGITSTMVTDVIGTGIKPQSRVDKDSLGIDEEVAQNFQRIAERAWERWASFADAANKLNFYGIEQLTYRQILENGEVIIIPLMINEPDRPYMLALDIVEADRLATPIDKMGDRKIRSGVELGDRGEPVAYWIRKGHPGDFTLRLPKSDDFIRYPARNKYGRPNILHLYEVKRPGQTRGEPFFAPVMALFKDLADYMEAELVAARVAACFAVFIRNAEAYASAVNSADSTNIKSQRIQALEPGMLKYLSPGEEVETFNPNRPGGTFEPFVERILRTISSGLNLPYELLAKDFSRTNYSSARAALLEAIRFFRTRQDWIARCLCQPVWNMLIEEAYLKEEMTLPNFYENRLDWLRVRWIAPGFSWVDPLKEAKAAVTSLDNGLTTLADEIAGQGKDWEEVIEQKGREAKKIKEVEEKYNVRIIKDENADKDTKEEPQGVEEPAVVRK